MITFKTFLIESQNYPLYHGTDITSLESIIKDNVLKTGFISDTHWPSKTGSIVSLTRNLKFAKQWSKDVSYGGSVIIKFNRSKLKNNYKITPFNFFGNLIMHGDSAQARWTPSLSKGTYGIERNQFEEAINKDITNVIKYIDAIYLDRHSLEILKNSPEIYNKIKHLIK